MNGNPPSQGRIVSLQLCPGHRKPMQPVERMEAIANLGPKGDRHALPESSRQVLLIEKETLDQLSLRPGEIKENVTTLGLELMKLTRGQRLKLGQSVVLEIAGPCTPCSRMEEISPGLLRASAGRRGMLARVMQGGAIVLGDTIQATES